MIMTSDNVNLHLSLTVTREHLAAAVKVVTVALQNASETVPDLVSSAVSVYEDDADDEEEDAEGIHIVVRDPVDARTFGRLADVNMAAAVALARNPFGRRGEDLS
jgi:hypothetical protein